MDAKITLSFDAAVINTAKKYAKRQGVSLSRLTEYLLKKVSDNSYHPIESLPVSDWVSALSEGDVQYITKKRGRKSLKNEFFNSRK
jgi:antitoxin component of RelBE/YafQ-DinJ toxin-antitoxin module